MENPDQIPGFNLLLLEKSSLKNSVPAYKHIGKIITGPDEKIISRKLTPTKIPSIDNIHKQFLLLFQDQGGILTQFHGLIEKPYVLKSEDVISVIFWVMKWRRCTGFLVFQKSNQGHRFLFYVCDKIMHHGVSFGTDCTGVRIDGIIDDFKKGIEENKIQIAKLQNIQVIINGKESITLENLLKQNRPIVCEVVYWGNLLRIRQIIDKDFSPDFFGI